jgi:hypothetical protein
MFLLEMDRGEEDVSAGEKVVSGLVGPGSEIPIAILTKCLYLSSFAHRLRL